VTFRPTRQPQGAHPLVEAPDVPIRVDRAQARDGMARADGRLEAHPFAGLEVAADAVVKDAAGQEARPSDSGIMTLPARHFTNPLARALIEQRQILALDANQRQRVAAALDALTIAPEKVSDSGVYLGLRFGYAELVNARSDDDLRGVLDYLWDMARSLEDGDMSEAEQRLADARKALEDALDRNASQEEISKLMDELRQAMQQFLQSYMAEMQKKGMQNLQQMPNQNMQALTDQQLQQMLDQIENLAKLGDRDAARELLSQLQQMLDNLQMAQPGQQQMSPMDQEAMRQMDELSKMMREQQRLMDQTFQLDQGRRPGAQQQGEGNQQPLTQQEMQELMEQLKKGQGQLSERLKKLLQDMQGQSGEQGQGDKGQLGEGNQGDTLAEQLGRSLGRAGRAMGDASRSLGRRSPGEAYGHQGDALEAMRDGLKSMMQQMFAQQSGPQTGQANGRPSGDRDPLGRPQRAEGMDLGTSVKVPDEIDVERARRIMEAIRKRLGERSRPRYELDYLERLLQGVQ
jgi:uncharacterized protein (TIGR02302 family)